MSAGLLLDTCAFLWMVRTPNDLSPAARDAVVDPGRPLFLSVLSQWEIGVKTQIDRLSKLPELHRDPFDRMLICQAIEHGLTIVTPDAAIQRYPVRVLW